MLREHDGFCAAASAQPSAVLICRRQCAALLNGVRDSAHESTRAGGQSSIEGEEAEIRISDSGVGIPPEKREKIFQLYFTTKKKGSGIGLAMTFRIVQLHNGKIDFFSEPGKGTTFVLRFPLEGSSQ